jgi:histidyl-tRNA synthetase
MFADAMEALGIPRGSYVVKVNNRKVLDGLMTTIGLGGEHNANRRLSVFRAIDKLDRFGREGVTELLGKGRLDESGDYTQGAGLDQSRIELVFKALDLRFYAHDEEGGLGIEGLDRHLMGGEHMDQLLTNGLGELDDLQRIFVVSGYGPDRIRIDPSVVRGLEYYTGSVYEVELTFEVADEEGKPVRFGSVGGGGRYDGLIGRFRAEDVPATGISIGVSRLQAALTHLGKLNSEPPTGPVVVTVMDKARIAEYQQMVSELRNAGIRSELYLGDSGFKAQMKYCDRRNSPLAVIQGSDEAARGEVQIKDLKKGAALAALAKTITDREEYQRLSAQAQYAVRREELVAKVREALA